MANKIKLLGIAPYEELNHSMTVIGEQFGKSIFISIPPTWKKDSSWYQNYLKKTTMRLFPEAVLPA